MSETAEPQPIADAGVSAYFDARHRLLNPPWSEKRLNLRETRGAGLALAGNPGDLRLFGMDPIAWYVLGIRIMGRTAVEATRDRHARFFARSIAQTLFEEGQSVVDVIDPFVGSGNLMFHVVRTLKADRGVGLDVNAEIMARTKGNFARLRSVGALRRAKLTFAEQDWSRVGDFMRDVATLVVLSPPWADAFNAGGLDLRRTTPPVPTVLSALSNISGAAPLFVAVQTHPLIVEESVAELRAAHRNYPSLSSDDEDISKRIDYLLLRLR